MMILKKYFLLVFLLVFTNLYSQKVKTDVEKERDEIYSLLQESDGYNGSNDLKSLELANKAILLSEKVGTSREKATSYLFVANILSSLGMYKKSFIYLEKSNNEEYSKTDIHHQVIIKSIKANNYEKLNLKSQALSELNGVLQISDENPKDYSLLFFKAQALVKLGFHYSEIGKLDFSLGYLNKAELVLKKFPIEETVVQYYEIPNLYLAKGDVFLKKKMTDSTFYYLNKGFELLKKNKENLPTFHSFYSSYGDYYYHKKDYNNALEFYLKSIREMDKHHINDVDSKILTFKNISNIYGILDQSKKKEIYLSKYYKESEKLSVNNVNNIQKAVDHIIKEKKNEISSIKERSTTWIFSVIIILICSLILFWIVFKKINKKQKKAISVIESKEAIIIEKEQQAKELKLRVNDTFDEILLLAKENHPNFYTRFQEVYPDFHGKLLDINPKLHTSELVLLAYIYLNFESKEIADFTYKSPKTIQNRKHLLRKKLNIPTSDDMSVWLKSICK